MTANSQEVSKDNWLCPMSGKNFNGPEFVRKHIMTKRLQKLEVRVSYFNDYLYDSNMISIWDSYRGERDSAPHICGEGKLESPLPIPC